MDVYLKKGGLILIREPEISFFLKFLLFIMDDEAWSYKIDIFNSKKNIFNHKSPWDANNATANLLFNNEDKFSYHFPKYKIIKNELSEFLTFINSGGIVQEIPCIPVNRFIFSILSNIDRILIFLLPNIFALGRTVVLEKIK